MNFEIRNLLGHLVCELWPKTNFKRSQQGEKRDWWIPTDTFPLCCGSPFSILYCDDDRWENRLERICFHKKLSTRIKVCICTDSKEKQGEKALYSLSESQETNSGRGLLPKLLDYLDLIAKLSLKSFLFQLFILMNRNYNISLTQKKNIENWRIFPANYFEEIFVKMSEKFVNVCLHST